MSFVTCHLSPITFHQHQKPPPQIPPFQLPQYAQEAVSPRERKTRKSSNLILTIHSLPEVFSPRGSSHQLRRQTNIATHGLNQSMADSVTTSMLFKFHLFKLGLNHFKILKRLFLRFDSLYCYDTEPRWSQIFTNIKKKEK